MARLFLAELGGSWKSHGGWKSQDDSSWKSWGNQGFPDSQDNALPPQKQVELLVTLLNKVAPDDKKPSKLSLHQWGPAALAAVWWLLCKHTSLAALGSKLAPVVQQLFDALCEVHASDTLVPSVASLVENCRSEDPCSYFFQANHPCHHMFAFTCLHLC